MWFIRTCLCVQFKICTPFIPRECQTPPAVMALKQQNYQTVPSGYNKICAAQCSIMFWFSFIAFKFHMYYLSRHKYSAYLFLWKKEDRIIKGGQHLNYCINTLRPRQNGHHFPDNIFKCIFLNENIWFPINISLKFVPRDRIGNIPASVQIMAWHRPGDKPLSEPMMVRLLTHICVARPQWVNKNNAI